MDNDRLTGILTTLGWKAVKQVSRLPLSSYRARTDDIVARLETFDFLVAQEGRRWDGRRQDLEEGGGPSRCAEEQFLHRCQEG